MKGTSFEEVMKGEYEKEEHPIATEAVPEEVKKAEDRYQVCLAVIH